MESLSSATSGKSNNERPSSPLLTDPITPTGSINMETVTSDSSLESSNVIPSSHSFEGCINMESMEPLTFDSWKSNNEIPSSQLSSDLTGSVNMESLSSATSWKSNNEKPSSPLLTDPLSPPRRLRSINMGSLLSATSWKSNNEKPSSPLLTDPLSPPRRLRCINMESMNPRPSFDLWKSNNEITSSQLSSDLTGPIVEEKSLSLSQQEPIDDANSSNLAVDQTAGQKHTENQARSQAEENVEDDLGKSAEETNQKKQLTDQEIMSKKNSLFQRLNKAIKNIHQCVSSANEDGKATEDLQMELEWISNFIFEVKKIGPLSVADLNKYREEAGNQLSEHQSVPVICNVVTKGWQGLVRTAKELPSNLTLAAISILWNFSNYSPKVTFDIIAESAFLNTLEDILNSYLQERIQMEEMSREESQIIGASLSIIHNLSKVDENIIPLREKGFVNCVSPYLNSKTKLDRFKALATLASLIDEKESEILQGKDELLTMFLENLGRALKTPSRICVVNTEGWSALECTLTIRLLARNHANKRLLVQMGCLPHLTKLADIGTDEEKKEAVGAIWYLAFNKDNRIKMLEDKELNIVDLLTAIRENSKDKTTKETADDTLRLLNGHLQNNEKNNDKVRASERQQSSSDIIDTKTKRGHIMISYNWSHQEVAIKIRDKLKANGYSVWMDIDNMGGCIFTAMAEAVEKSHVVLICMSKQYQKSDNCKREATYASQCKKEVVPLKMEQDYKPIGWLGIIMGAHLYYDFSGRDKYQFETKCEELLKRMAALYCEDRSKTKDDVDGRPDHQSSLTKLKEWTQMQVNDWLDRNHLPKDVLEHLTGKDLAALIRMKDKAPETFYRWLEKKLKLENLSTMETFIEALDHL